MNAALKARYGTSLVPAGFTIEMWSASIGSRCLLQRLAALAWVTLCATVEAQTYSPQSPSRLAVSFTTERVGSGRVLVYGEVRNGASAACERVIVGVEGLDENGRVISRGRAFVLFTSYATMRSGGIAAPQDARHGSVQRTSVHSQRATGR